MKVESVYGDIELSVNKRNLTEKQKCLLYLLALTEMGPIYVFSLNLSHETQKMMKESGRNYRDYFMERLSLYFGCSGFFFVIEYSPAKNIHIHGFLVLNGRFNQMLFTMDPVKALRAIKREPVKASGDRRKIPAKDHIIYNTKNFRFCPPVDYLSHGGDFGALGWVNYICKDIRKTKAMGLVEGTLIGKSRSVSQQADEIHKRYKELR